MSMIPTSKPAPEDDGPALAGNPAAGNPDGLKSEDLADLTLPESEEDDE